MINSSLIPFWRSYIKKNVLYFYQADISPPNDIPCVKQRVFLQCHNLNDTFCNCKTVRQTIIYIVHPLSLNQFITFEQRYTTVTFICDTKSASLIYDRIRTSGSILSKPYLTELLLEGCIMLDRQFNQYSEWE